MGESGPVSFLYRYFGKIEYTVEGNLIFFGEKYCVGVCECMCDRLLNPFYATISIWPPKYVLTVVIKPMNPALCCYGLYDTVSALKEFTI